MVKMARSPTGLVNIAGGTRTGAEKDQRYRPYRSLNEVARRAAAMRNRKTIQAKMKVLLHLHSRIYCTENRS
jgi:hypothetical protein